MDGSEFTKIVIAAVVGAIAKELFTGFVNLSKSAVTKGASRAGPWLEKNWPGIDLFLSVLIFAFIFYWFFTFPEKTEPVTHGTVSRQILLAAMAALEYRAILRAAGRYYDEKRRPNQSVEPTPGSVTSRAD